MLFNSIAFIFFFLIFFCVYWFVLRKNLKLQNMFIVAASYLFYGWWDPRFLILIAFTSVVSYLSGVWIEKIRQTGGFVRNPSKWVAATNVILNLGILCVFKYFNFFSENLSKLFDIFGYELDWFTLDVLLPVGISFYTFQALSYTIDVYKQKIEPTKDLVAFLAFVSFFPQLVAGPIERASNLLPQFYIKRRFDYARAVDGARQMLWGFFKKLVVADNCASMVNAIFADYQQQNALTLVIGAVFFGFQIYGDFSGYSDIAIGSARIFGFNLMQNFKFPYFSRDIAEFWRRWHISLNTWFRDYVYIPLGGSRGTKFKVFRNTMVIFILSGLWHGANWTFIAWGFFNAVLFLPLTFIGKNRKNTGEIVKPGKILPDIRTFLNIILTFVLVTIGWILFRSDTIGDAVAYFFKIFTAGGWNLDFFISSTQQLLAFCICLFAITMTTMCEWRAMIKGDSYFKSKGVTIIAIIIVICLLGAYKDQLSFIYFQL